MDKSSVPLCTDTITDLDAATAAELVKRGGWIELPSLRSMSTQAARELLNLVGVKDAWGVDLGNCALNDEIARILLPLASKIEIGNPSRSSFGEAWYEFEVREEREISGYEELTVEVARFFASMVRSLADDRGMTCALVIKSDVKIRSDSLAAIAEEIGPCVDLHVYGLSKITDDILRSLQEFSGGIFLPDLAEFPQSLSQLLSRNNASVLINGKTEIGYDALKDLVGSAGELVLGMECHDIKPETAAALANAKCRLRVHARRLSLELATHIARSSCPEFVVIGIDKPFVELDGNVAAALSTFRGELRVEIENWGSDDGYVSLIRKLAGGGESQDAFSLTARTISCEVARALAAQPRREISLRLCELSDPIADELARFEGALKIFEPPVSASVARRLSRKKGPGALELWSKSLENDVVEALSKCSVALSLRGIEIVTKFAAEKLRSALEGDFQCMFVEELHDAALYSNSMARLKRLILADEPVDIVALQGGLGTKHRGIEVVSIERCHGLQFFEFCGLSDAEPRPEPPLVIRIVDCSDIDSIEVHTERFCAQGLQLRALPNIQYVSLSVPDLVDLGALRALESLSSLRLSNCPRLKSLDGIEALSNLSSLVIDNCPQLPSIDGVNWLGNLSRVSIRDCQKLESLESLVVLPKLKSVDLKGKTLVRSLRVFRERSDVSFDVESVGLSAPPSLIKNFFKEEGAIALYQFRNCTVECSACGGTEFHGSCHGWYSDIQIEQVRRSAPLLITDLVNSATKMAKELVLQLLNHGLEDLDGSHVRRRYPVLHAEVACRSCDSIFDPASFGVDPEQDGNWSQIGDPEESEFGGFFPSGHSDSMPKDKSGLVVREWFEKDDEADGVKGAHSCPICCTGNLRYAMLASAQRESDGKFSGHVSIANTMWNKLLSCFHVDEADEKFAGGWLWRTLPREDRMAILDCDSDCFEAQVAQAEHVPRITLAALAAAEACRPEPRVNRVADWIAVLVPQTGEADELVDASKDQLLHLKIQQFCEDEDEDASFLEQRDAKVRDIAKRVLDDALGIYGMRQPKEQDPGLPLQGRVFCFSGRIEGLTRAQCEARVKALGATTASGVTKKVTDVVVGDAAGSKRDEALALGLRVLDAVEFLKLLPAAGAEGKILPKSKPPKKGGTRRK